MGLRTHRVVAKLGDPDQIRSNPARVRTLTTQIGHTDQGAEMPVRIKRVYAEPGSADGERILVDRLWPRGLSKRAAKVDLWLKDVAPSTELRKWFGHTPERWPEFKRRYIEELKASGSAFVALRELTHSRTATLLYGAKDEEHNEAVVLLEELQKSG